MNICKKCADKAQSLGNIKGDCPSVGGLTPRVFYAELPENGFSVFVKNTDGSVFEMDLGSCKNWATITQRNNLANVVTTKTATESGLVYDSVVNLFINDLQDQATKNKIRTLENRDRIVLIYETQNKTFEMVGWKKGIKGNGGQRLTGANQTEVNRNEVVLQGIEDDYPITIDKGSYEETLEYLNSLVGEQIAPYMGNMDLTINSSLTYQGMLSFLKKGDTIYSAGKTSNGVAIGRSFDFGKSFNIPNETAIAELTPFVKGFGWNEVAGVPRFVMVDNTGTWDVNITNADTGSNIGLTTILDGSTNNVEPIKLIAKPNTAVGYIVIPEGVNLGFTDTTDGFTTLSEALTMFFDGAAIATSAVTNIALAYSPDGTLYLAMQRTNNTLSIYKQVGLANFELVGFTSSTLTGDLQINFVNANLLFIYQDDGNATDRAFKIFRSEDGGANITSVFDGTTRQTLSPVVQNSLGLFAGYYNENTNVFTLIYSRDCGVTWKSNVFEQGNYSLNLSLRSFKEALAIDNDYILFGASNLGSAIAQNIAIFPCINLNDC